VTDTPTAEGQRSLDVEQRDQLAWLAAIALYVVGDVATTAVGLQIGAVEKNPAALALFDAVGLWPAMLLLKGAVLVLVGGLWACTPHEWRAVAPATLAAVGAVVVAINGHVLGVLLLDAGAVSRPSAVEVLLSLGVILA